MDLIRPLYSVINSRQEIYLLPRTLLRKLKLKNTLASSAFFIVLCQMVGPLMAQDNYEIQVYGSETVAPKTTMLELHSNFTVDGSKPVPGSEYAADGTYPTNHALHE